LIIIKLETAKLPSKHHLTYTFSLVPLMIYLRAMLRCIWVILVV